MADAAAVAVLGFGGAVSTAVRPGDLVVATEVHGGSGGAFPLPAAAVVTAALRRAGLRVHAGPVVSVERVAHGARRHALSDTGAIAVDMESAWLAPGMLGRPAAVVRAIVDTPDHPIVSFSTIRNGLRARSVLERAAAVLETWAAACGPRTVLLATQKRQTAVREVAARCELVLVVGSPSSSNANRLVEVAHRGGRPAHLVEDETELDLSWLAGIETVGITAAASAPEVLVERLVDAMRSLGDLEVREHLAVTESVRFPLPMEVR